MNSLQVVVLERDNGVRRNLKSRLFDQGVESVCETTDRHNAVRLCFALPADLLLCGLSDGSREGMDMLRDIASLRPAPAVAFLDAGSLIGEYESLCLSLNLNYLGLLTAPVDPARLGRMLGLLQRRQTRKGDA